MAFAESVALALLDEGPRTKDEGQMAVAGPAPRLQGYDAQNLGLTEREVEVLGLLAAGLTNKEIAERLVLSHRTVQAHLYRIFSKLNVTTRSAATRTAIERHIV